jgi:hypothetical protein
MSQEKLDMFAKHLVYEVQMPTGGTRKIDRDELERLSLNAPNPIPELNGGKTWISNYVGTYWSHFMGPVPFAIYFQILKMAYGEKDYAFPTVPYLAMLIGVSPSSVQRHMKKLIDLNFVIVVEVKNSWNNEHLPNLYMLSNTIPFISTAQYKALPARLQKEHDKFMDKIKKRKLMSEENMPNYESTN